MVEDPDAPGAHPFVHWIVYNIPPDAKGLPEITSHSPTLNDPKAAMQGLNSMRPIVAARGIGLAEGALMYATEYVQGREAFGQTIADFQGIQWEIAKLATEIEAARLLTYRAAWLADQGKFGKEWVPYLSMAKYHATELAVRASGLAERRYSRAA